MKLVWTTNFEGRIWICETHPDDIPNYEDRSWRWGYTEEFVFCGGEPVFHFPKWMVIA